MKVFLKILLLTALTVYLVVAFVRFTEPDHEQRCVAVEVVVEDSARVAFVDAKEVRRLLKQKRIDPENKLMERVDSRKIENELRKMPFIDEALCYKTAAGTVKIRISQRLPVLRVMDDRGNDYYMDAKGRTMPRLNYPANVVVVTGSVTPKYAAKHLVSIGRLLQENAFWDGQIVQLHIDKRGGVEMIPRVGEHVVYLGEPKEVPEKLHRLRAFYEKVLPEVGWNRYALINLEFSNQIICKKKQ